MMFQSTVYIYDKEKASEQRHSQGLEMEEYRRKLADEAMTDDSMMAGFWNLSRTARVYAVREDFITFTVIVS